MLKKLFLLSLALCAIASSAYSQFVISGEFRPRTELSHGYKSLAAPDQKASLFTMQRTRLNLFYKTDLYTTKLVLQDVRTWGNQPQLVGNEDMAASIHEAWAELKLFENATLKVGRQEVIYDNHRIFGSVGWAQQARSHDMALFKYEGGFKVHFGLAYNQNTNRTNNFYNGPDAYKALQLIWLAKEFDNLNVSLLFLNNGTPFAEKTDTITGNLIEQSTKYSQTVGPRIVYKISDLTFSGNFYYQGGKDNANNDLSAYEANIEGQYKLSSGFQFVIGYELLSGTAYDETSKNKSFTPLYGTNHKFNGFMDYFYVGNHMNSVGLSDFYVKAKYAQKKFFVDLHLHSFSAAQKINADADKSLGVEVDLWAGYNISKAVNVKAGYSQMFGTESLELIRGGSKDETSNWAWIMLTFKPTFLNFKLNQEKNND